MDFANLSAHSPQQRRRRVRKKQSTIERPTLYSICSYIEKSDLVKFKFKYLGEFEAKSEKYLQGFRWDLLMKIIRGRNFRDTDPSRAGLASLVEAG